MIRNKNRDRMQTGGRAIAAALGCLALLLPLILCGCAQQRQWSKAGLSQAAFDQDAARCRREAARAAYREPFANASGLEYSVAQEKIFEQCMFAKGYRLGEDSAGR